jgi:hypothetical protein
MADLKLISDYIDIVPGFLRSTNLSNDWKKTKSKSDYIITPNVSQSLDRVYNGLIMEDGQQAFTLIGPYGSGKSAFAVFLCRLMGIDPVLSGKAMDLLSKADTSENFTNEQIRTVKKKKQGFLPIVITARRRPISQLLLEGILDAVHMLEDGPGTSQLILRIQEALDKNYWEDSDTVLNFLLEIQKEVRVQELTGLFICIDEAGKTLEYALQDKNGGDVYIFQQIAEFANRQKGVPVLFLIILHQMFDDYVELSDRTVRNEWAKVQERFQSIQFNESVATTINMVGQAVKRQHPLPKAIENEITKELEKLTAAGVSLPLGMDVKAFTASAKSAWPLHPTVLLAIPHLFRRLAQNERSIFSYLTSMEPFGFLETIRNMEASSGNFIRLTDIYAYLLANFEVGLSRIPHAKRLLEANDIINSNARLTQEQLDLIRSISLLNVLGEMSTLKATPELLACTASNIQGVSKELGNLRTQSILTYRRLDETYRVWEGSDVDIHARMKEARRKLQLEGKSLYETLSRHLPTRSMLARRHSLETGAHRYFKVVYAERIKGDGQGLLSGLDGAAGIILVLLPQADHRASLLKIEQVTQRQPRIIVALPRQIDALRGGVEEVACLNWVGDHTEELRDDRVAKRELDMRLAEGEQRINQLLQILLDPRPAPTGNSCQWFWAGKDREIRHTPDVARLLSTACDQIYSKGPKVKNELVARRKISGAATSARRCLMERMLNHQDLENLGIEGYPPERSIYASVLHAAGIHVVDTQSGKWKFQAPPKKNKMNLAPCWAVLEETIFSSETEKIPLDVLFDKLAQAPYGLPHGIHPILFTAFYILNQNDLFLYRQNSFLPDPQMAQFDLLQKRPELFSVSGARTEGIRDAVVRRLAKGLDQPPKTASVVRALFKVLHSLPQITLKSSRFEDELGLKFKDCLVQAQSPEQLLFNDLPACYGLAPFKENQKRTEDIHLFFDQLNKSLTSIQQHAGHLLDKSRDILLEKCGLPRGEDGWLALEQRAAWLDPRTANDALTPFFRCIGNGALDHHNPKSAISCVAGRPFAQWTDMDIERFPGLAEGIGEQYKAVWEIFGQTFITLTPEEQKQKKQVASRLGSQLQEFTKDHSPNAIAAALRELLSKVESNASAENPS